jgi:hypothetical protein
MLSLDIMSQLDFLIGNFIIDHWKLLIVSSWTIRTFFIWPTIKLDIVWNPRNFHLFTSSVVLWYTSVSIWLSEEIYFIIEFIIVEGIFYRNFLIVMIREKRKFVFAGWGVNSIKQNFYSNSRGVTKCKILLVIDWKVVFFNSKNICFYQLPLLNASKRFLQAIL